MSALVSRGYQSPATAGGGGGGAGGASGNIVPFILYSTAGVPTSAVDLSGSGVVKISINGGDYVDAVGTAPVNIVGRTGHYYYELDVTEKVNGQTTLVSVVKVGFQNVLEKITIPDNSVVTNAISSAVSALSSAISSAVSFINTNTDAEIAAVPTAADIDAALTSAHGAGSWAGDTATVIRDAILDYELRPGRTLRGHWRRLDALFFGKVTGMLGTLVRAWRPGFAAVEFEAVQDPVAGTRAEVDVTDSEVP